MSNEHTNNEFENMQLGEIAIKLGYITRAQLNSLLKELDSRSESGDKYLIGEELVQRKLLDKKQLKHILSLQNRIILSCQSCYKRFSIKNYDPNRVYKCPNCAGLLSLPPSKAKLDRESERMREVGRTESQEAELLLSSQLSEIAREAFNISDEPFDRYSEFLRSFSDDKDVEAREVREIIDTDSEEIEVLAKNKISSFESEFTINDPENFKMPKSDTGSAVDSKSDDSFVVGDDTQYLQSGISVLKILEQEQGVRASIDLSTDPVTERHLKKLHRGDNINKYVLYDEVGRGGMGVVKLSFDQDIRRQIATKIIHPTSKEVPSKQERFLEEAQITGQLEHPNIVPVHDLGIDKEGNLFFTMKLVRGKSLLEVIELVADKKDGYDKYFTVTRLLQIFMKICDAVAFAHSKGVLHRDLKPENVMVGDYGEVMVMDWGLAKVKGLPDKQIDQVSTDRSVGKIHQTLDGSIVGTPGYMAPEQARGELDEVTERSDIYSLGAILYEMLTFKQAFPGSDSSKVIQKVKRHKFLPPSIASPEKNIPRELEHVVLNAMAFNPDDRYLTVNQLKEEVEAYIDGRVLSSVDYSMFQLFVKWFVKNLTSLSIAVLIAIAVLITAIIWANDLTDERDEAIERYSSIYDESNKLKTDLAEANKNAKETLTAANIRYIENNIISAIKNNDFVKLRALQLQAPKRFKNICKYWIERNENKVIEDTKMTFYGKVLISSSIDGRSTIISSGNNLSIFDSLNKAPSKTTKLRNVPVALKISDDSSTFVACYNGGEYEIFDGLGTMINTDTIRNIDFRDIVISPLSNYIALVQDDNQIHLINRRDYTSNTINLGVNEYFSNIQFISDTEFCFCKEKTVITKVTINSELNVVNTSSIQADFDVNKIFVKGESTYFIDTQHSLWRTQTDNLIKLSSIVGLFDNVDVIKVNSEIYTFDFESNYLWEVDGEVINCRDVVNGNVLRKFRLDSNVDVIWQNIYSINNELFIINQQGRLYKIANQYYNLIPIHFNTGALITKIWKSDESFFMLSPNGLFKHDDSSLHFINITNSYENKILHSTKLDNDLLLFMHEDGRVSVYDIKTSGYYFIPNLEITTAIHLDAYKTKENATDYNLLVLDNSKTITCYNIDSQHIATNKWSIRAKYLDTKKVAIVPETDKIFILEYNNQINSYNLSTGKLYRELVLKHDITEFFSIDDGSTLLTRDPNNEVRLVNVESLQTVLQFSNPHFSKINKCFTDETRRWLVSISADEISLRYIPHNQHVLSLKKFASIESTFIESKKQQLYFIDRDSHTLQTIDLRNFEEYLQN